MSKSILINLVCSFYFCYFAEQYLNKNKMKDFFLKAKEWIKSHSLATNLLILAVFLMFTSTIYVVIKPEDFTPLTALVVVSLLLVLSSNILRKQ